MLQLQHIRQNPEEYITRLNLRNIDGEATVNSLLKLDETKRLAQNEYDEKASEINILSKQVGQMMAQGQKQEAENIKGEVASIKEAQKTAQQKLQAAEQAMREALLGVPNAPQMDVPKGQKPEDNVVVREGGVVPKFDFTPKTHWELAEQHQMIDFETGTKITGSGFILYKNQGAKLERALINYFLDFNTQKGYQELLTPFMINEDSALGTGQLPDKEGQMYHDPVENLYLIPTAEVPVTNIYRDVILPEQALPIKLTAYSPCFRREAGSYGKDVRGLNRVHQFNKVEIVRLELPEQSQVAHQEMISHVEELLIALGLPYRLLHLCGGDMGYASANTYDFEVYSAAQERWLEVSSVSNFETFQTYRMKARYKNHEGKIQFLHTLNGSSLALPRIYASILENYQTANGIRIPEVLVPYMGVTSIGE